MSYRLPTEKEVKQVLDYCFTKEEVDAAYRAAALDWYLLQTPEAKNRLDKYREAYDYVHRKEKGL